MTDDGDRKDTVVSKGHCPDCGSHDNLVTYADGHRYCYTPGCGKKRSVDPDGTEVTDTKPKKEKLVSTTAIPFTSQNMPGGLKARGLDLETLSKAGYFVHKEGGKSVHVAPYYDQKGQLAYQKYRDKDKDFWFEPVVGDAPKTRDLQLFLQHVWGEKHDKKVVVTEGELDALSVAQAMNWKVPAVSIIQGADSAVKSLKANYRWLDRFEEIILWMDNDEVGQSVVAECASLFTPGKVKTIKVQGFKDASDLLQAGKSGEIYSAVWGATVWAPPGIVNARDRASDFDRPAAIKIADYPWPIINRHTRGILAKEVTYLVAGTGVGKTTHIVEIQHALIQAGIKFGVARFEDDLQKTQLDIMSRRVGRRLHLEAIDNPDTKYLKALHAETFDNGLVELFDPETADWSFEAILGYIRYMAKALDCKVIFLDPLSFVVAAVNAADERKALDHVAYKFSQAVKQLGIALIVTHHLNRGDGKAFEEGGEISLKNIRGSAGIANFSMGVFAFERNQQGERPDLARIRGLKHRFSGWTGIGDTLKWDDEKGHYEPTDEPYPDSGGSEFGDSPIPTSQDY